MDEKVQEKYNMVNNLEYTYVRTWIFKFKFHMLVLEVINVQWPDDDCLSQWAWTPIWKHLWFQVLSTVHTALDVCFGNMQHPRHEN